MQCDRCRTEIPAGEAHDHLGQTLCEDCIVEVRSPLRTCDPWAVHSAKVFERHSGASVLTEIQQEILRLLEETGGLSERDIVERFGGRLDADSLRREFGTLRHMEKARAEKRGDMVILRLW